MAELAWPSHVSHRGNDYLAMVTATGREVNGEFCVVVGPVNRTAGKAVG